MTIDDEYEDGLPDEAFTELEREAGVPELVRGRPSRSRAGAFTTPDSDDSEVSSTSGRARPVIDLGIKRRASGLPEWSTTANRMYWLLTGHEFGGKFVYLPVGIPLHNPRLLYGDLRDDSKLSDPTNRFINAQNDLLMQVRAVAEKLAPGEEQLLDLEVRIHRWKTAPGARWRHLRPEREAVRLRLGRGWDSGWGFVQLPEGEFWLSYLEPVNTNSKNDEYRNFCVAQNALRERVRAVGDRLAPLEEKPVDLQVRLRRMAAGSAFQTQSLRLGIAERLLGELREEDGIWQPKVAPATAVTRTLRTFSSFQEALAWARANPGQAITRIPGGEGYAVNSPDPTQKD